MYQTDYLPNEPKLPNPEQQDLLTQRFLAPVSTQLIQLFTTLRRQLDRSLRAKQPVKLGKPYPLG